MFKRSTVIKILRPLAGALAGGLVGYLYYHFFGCTGNSCPLTSSPITTMVLFGLSGLILMIKK